MFMSLIALSAAHAEVSIGAGGGLPYGIGGVSVEALHTGPGGFGISAHAGVGVAATVGAHIWSPGEKVRFGLGSSVSALWEDIGYSSGSSCGYALVEEGQTAPDPTFQVSPSVYSVDVAVDHDVGAPGGLGLRYGLGAGLVIAGCVGGILPVPTIALSYRF
jgi:hypothetical protein